MKILKLRVVAYPLAVIALFTYGAALTNAVRHQEHPLWVIIVGVAMGLFGYMVARKG